MVASNEMDSLRSKMIGVNEYRESDADMEVGAVIQININIKSPTQNNYLLVDCRSICRSLVDLVGLAKLVLSCYISDIKDKIAQSDELVLSVQIHCAIHYLTSCFTNSGSITHHRGGQGFPYNGLPPFDVVAAR